MVRQDKSKQGRVTPKAGEVAAKSNTDKEADSDDSASSTKRKKVSREPVKVAGPSPIIIPILMFGLWGLGALVLLANYTVRGFAGMPSNIYLGVGLLFILLGFIPATRFR